MVVVVWVVLGLGVIVFGGAVVYRLATAEPAGREDAQASCNAYRAAVKLAGVESDSLVKSMTALAQEKATVAAERNSDYRPLHRAMVGLTDGQLQTEDVFLANAACEGVGP